MYIQIRKGDRKQVCIKRKFTFIEFRLSLKFIIIRHVYLFRDAYRNIRNNFYFCCLKSLGIFYYIFYSLDKIIILIFVLLYTPRSSTCVNIARNLFRNSFGRLSASAWRGGALPPSQIY